MLFSHVSRDTIEAKLQFGPRIAQTCRHGATRGTRRAALLWLESQIANGSQSAGRKALSLQFLGIRLA